MSVLGQEETLGVPKCTLNEFLSAFEGQMALLTGLCGDYTTHGLSLKAVRRPMLVTGKPGIGKTCGILSCIAKMNEKLPANKKIGFKKILLGQTIVGDLTGIPVVDSNDNVKRSQMPDLPNPARDGEYGVLFLDEITTADEAQIQPALGLCDDSRSLGEYTLPEHWLVVAAGNGPDCTNFKRMDDMTLSRFSVYDVAYDYVKDYRPYAHESGLNEDIIAFLNFSPDMCMQTMSTDMNKAGQLFPCPRTWERLSDDLLARKVQGKSVHPDDMASFAGRIVGIEAGRKFWSFMQFRKNLQYDVQKILAGTERPPEPGMAVETYHIIMESLFKIITREIESAGGFDNMEPPTLGRVANMFKWFLQFTELDKQLNTIFEIRDELPDIAQLMYDDDFVQQLCPELDVFFDEHRELLCQSADELQHMRI